jgi:hypothetical protein
VGYAVRQGCDKTQEVIMVWVITAFVLSSGVFLSTVTSAQTAAQDSASGRAPGIMSVLPPDVRPKIQALALILQENLAGGRLSDSGIQRDLQNGNLPAVIQGLGPDAGRLLGEIKASLQAHHSEESLMMMLQLLMGSAHSSGLMPSDESVER